MIMIPVSVGRNTSFWRAFALQSSGTNCSPPPYLMLRKLVFGGSSFLEECFITDTGTTDDDSDAITYSTYVASTCAGPGAVHALGNAARVVAPLCLYWALRASACAPLRKPDGRFAWRTCGTFGV
eukprot:GHVR01143631.1.p2 GENE.GHVR01143631.1~~GHVR01143631.1.p2  ORF type:complete len:125 (-),score=13.29 GHVR01143631.1:407-781(-)